MRSKILLAVAVSCFLTTGTLLAGPKIRGLSAIKTKKGLKITFGATGVKGKTQWVVTYYAGRRGKKIASGSFYTSKGVKKYRKTLKGKFKSGRRVVVTLRNRGKRARATTRVRGKRKRPRGRRKRRRRRRRRGRRNDLAVRFLRVTRVGPAVMVRVTLSNTFRGKSVRAEGFLVHANPPANVRMKPYWRGKLTLKRGLTRKRFRVRAKIKVGTPVRFMIQSKRKEKYSRNNSRKTKVRKGKGKKPKKGRPVKFETIAQGSNSGHSYDKSGKNLVIRTAKAWKKFWTTHGKNRIPAPALPEVNFKKQMVIAVMMGQRTSGGYSITISKINRSGRKNMQVQTIGTQPNGAAPDVMTQPFHIVRLKRMAGKVTFAPTAAATTAERSGSSSSARE